MPQSLIECLAICKRIDNETRGIVSEINSQTVPVQWENQPEAWLAEVRCEEVYGMTEERRQAMLAQGRCPDCGQTLEDCYHDGIC